MDRFTYELLRWLRMNDLSTEGVEVTLRFKNEHEAMRVRAQLIKDFNAATLHDLSPDHQLRGLTIRGIGYRLPQIEDIPQPIMWSLPWPVKHGPE